MVILIAGASHVGKTVLAQRLLERYQFPYLSMDWLKMGLIRSGQTRLTPMDGAALTDYLWPIVREMIRTVIENGQDLIVEGCYIPFDWAKDFDSRCLSEIRYTCLVMSRRYIENHWADIQAHASDVERRKDDSDCTMDAMIADNEECLRQCRLHGCPYWLIDGDYMVEPDFCQPFTGKAPAPRRR